MKNFKHLSISLLASFALVSCGGGGEKSVEQKKEQEKLPVNNGNTNTQTSSSSNAGSSQDNQKGKCSKVHGRTIIASGISYVVDASVFCDDYKSSVKSGGSYSFSNSDNNTQFNTNGLIHVKGGYLGSANGIKSYDLYANSDKMHVNPFSTFVAKVPTSEDAVAKFFDIGHYKNVIDSDVSKNNDMRVAEALAYAYGMLQIVENENKTHKEVFELFKNKKQAGEPLGLALLKYTQIAYFKDIHGKSKDEIVEITKDIIKCGSSNNCPKVVSTTKPNKSTSTNEQVIPKPNVSPKPNTNEKPKVDPNLTKDGYHMVKVTLDKNSSFVPLNAKVVRLDKIAFFVNKDNRFVENISDDIYPPNPPTFPKELNVTKGKSSYSLHLSDIMPKITYVDYK